MPKISVIMSVYKGIEAYLRLSIESILNQTERDFEYIIVLDDVSNSFTKKILQEYSSKDKRIKLIYNECNIGLTKSLNRAIGVAQGEYVARMDADDISEANRLEVQLKYLIDNDLDMVGCSLCRIAENGNVVNKLTNQSYPPDCIAELLKYDNCVPHPSWFVRKRVYRDLMGYRDIHSCEDYDFLLRAIKRDIKIGICDNVLLSYRINTKGISRSNSLRQILTSNYLQRNMDRLEDITQEEIESYLEKIINQRKVFRYEKAVQLLNHIIEEMKSGNRVGICRLPISFFLSRYIGINIIQIVKMQIIKRKYMQKSNDSR